VVNDLVQTLQKRQEMCQPLPQASSISQAASRKRSSPSLRAIGPVAGELLERVECAPKAADPEWALRENQHTSLLVTARLRMIYTASRSWDSLRSVPTAAARGSISTELDPPG